MHRRFLLIGDPHYRKDNAVVTDKFETVIYALLDAESYDAIVVLGDVLDTHETYDARPLRRITCFLLALATRHPTYCLIGNHDRITPDDFMSHWHPFPGFEFVPPPNLWIIFKAQRFGDCVFVPYVPDNRFREALATVDMTGVRAIFAHQTIRDAQLGSGKSDIAEAWLPDDPPVFSGHIHEYQRVHPNWLYVGTPFPHEFVKTNPRKTVSVVTLVDTTEDNPYGFTEDRLWLCLPGKLKEDLTVSDVTDRLTAGWIPAINMAYKWCITGRHAEIQTLAKNPAYQALVKNIKLYYEYTDRSLPVAPTPTTKRSYLDILTGRLVTAPLAMEYFRALLTTG